MSNDLIEAIKDALPAEAELYVVNCLSGFDLAVSWKLGDDPERPNKRSKTIVSSVSKEVSDDFSCASGQVKQLALARLRTFLTKNFQQFNPNHSSPIFEPPPVERWQLTTSVLFG